MEYLKTFSKREYLLAVAFATGYVVLLAIRDQL